MPLSCRPSYLAACIAAGIVFLLYLLTLAPTTAMWDAGEYMAAAYVMGVPHPPGNPLFILLGRAFAVLPIAPTAAQRINILAALCSAIAAGFWFLVAERIVVSWLRERWQRWTAGALAALIGATAFTVWNHSVVNEKVYTITLLGIAAVSWLALRWLDEEDAQRRDRLLVLAAYLMVLGYTNHMGGLLVAPALGVLVLVSRPATLLRWRMLLICAAAAMIGFTPYATQVIRASFQPAINMGATSACAGSVELSCLTSAETATAFRAHLNRDQYAKPSLLDRQAPLPAQLGTYWVYFKWQWVRDIAGSTPGLQNAMAMLFLGLGLVGGWLHFTRDRRTFWYMGTLVATLGVGLVLYMNFRLGWTHAALRGPVYLSREFAEVRDRDYFFIWSFSSWGVWAAIGLVGCWSWLAEFARVALTRAGRGVHRLAWGVTAPVLLIALVPLAMNWSAASRRGETFTAEWARDILRSLDPYSVLITFGDNDSYPIWYAQEVEGVRRDVRTAVATLLGTTWYASTILHQPQHPYRPERGAQLIASPGIYPPSPLLSLTPPEARAMELYGVLQQPARFQHAGISAVVPAGLITKDQLLILSMIRDSFPQRSIYFTPPGDYLTRLGLDEYLVREGLVYRLNTPAELERGGVVQIPDVERIDIQRSLALWDSLFAAPEALIAQGRWVDRPSVNIPYAYIRTALLMAAALDSEGRQEESQRVLERADRMARVVGAPTLLP
jgi:hypothetical protein